MLRVLPRVRGGTLLRGVLPPQRCRRSFASEAASAPAAGKGGRQPVEPLCFLSASAYSPEPSKAAKGKQGEDAWFVSDNAVGVADGVGGWAEQGVDAGIYSRALMSHARDFCVQAAAAGGAAADPLTALEYAHRHTNVIGSSTACIATVGADGLLRICNLGDSGLMVWRHFPAATLAPVHKLPVTEAARLWSQVAATKPQQCGFNFPYQLEHGTRANVPADADLLLIQPKAGDIVIASTDGLFDNLFTDDVNMQLAKFDYAPCQTLVRARRRRARDISEAADAEVEAAGGGGKPLQRLAMLAVQPEAPISDAELQASEAECRAVLQAMAAMLVAAAQRIGLDGKARTPFSVGARAARFDYSGGKPDDVVVVAAMVLPQLKQQQPAGGGQLK